MGLTHIKIKEEKISVPEDIAIESVQNKTQE